MTRNVNLKLGGLIAFLVVATVLTACAQVRKFEFAGSSPAATSAPELEELRVERRDPRELGLPSSGSLVAESPAGYPAPAPQAQQGILDRRQVIRTADLTIVV
ncbi:MAG: hypothetical protein D6791_13435, partial [Chloroflexi bacterium]